MLTLAVALAVLACCTWPSRVRPAAGSPATAGLRGRGRAGRLEGRLRRARWQRWRGGPGVSERAWVADFAEVVAVGLDAGLDLPAAAHASARSPSVRSNAPWLAARLEALAEEGGGVSRAITAPEDTTGEECRDLEVLAAAWRLAEEVGAGASAVTTAAAAVVRDRRAAQDRAGAVAAGPHASMTLLTALPLAGPVAALLVGLGPTALYRSPGGAASAALGMLLTGAGWWWSSTLLRRAARPGLTGGGLG